jgi:ribosomal protein S18 acetylase RimI-like enzyme
MSPEIEFKRLSWDDLRKFLASEASQISRDVDQEVRTTMSFSLYCDQTVEGFYLNGDLVGFARWDKRDGNLSNIYVSPKARGRGIARRFIEERPLRTLYVMPHNHLAKKLYASLGFIASPCAVPTREFMTRKTA